MIAIPCFCFSSGRLWAASLSSSSVFILRDIYTLCDQHFTVAEHLLTHETPDLLMLVEMGVDRIRHAFWKQMDQCHLHYVPNAPFQAAIHDYYQHVDQHIHVLLRYCGDETVILVVSDHGARPLMGGVRINQYLQAEGYLTLKEQPDRVISLEQATIDWQKTKAWGTGGYYGLVLLNVRGREQREPFRLQLTSKNALYWQRACVQ